MGFGRLPKYWRYRDTPTVAALAGGICQQDSLNQGFEPNEDWGLFHQINIWEITNMWKLTSKHGGLHNALVEPMSTCKICKCDDILWF